MIKFLLVLLFLSRVGEINSQVDTIENKYLSYLKITQNILKRYPEATLIDIYKYFFQSRFGPEHLISDSLIAFQILQDELKSEEIKPHKSKPDSLLIELLYPEKKFVRVDLSLVKDRIIPINLFFSAFLQSAERYDSLDYEKWKNDWTKIVFELEKSDLKINRFKEDKIKIDGALRNNRFVFSHSQEYKKKYNPHYRLINLKIFQRFLLPYLNQYRIKFIE
ncbi:MAG: hypothetical protein N3F03_06690 [Ignavibacteria bacterium]|nr:hypothetical protein [Ignavibacteria bacterium]